MFDKIDSDCPRTLNVASSSTSQQVMTWKMADRLWSLKLYESMERQFRSTLLVGLVGWVAFRLAACQVVC